MNLAAAHAAIRTRFAAEWPSIVPVQYPNVVWKQNDTPKDGPWARLVIQDADARWASMGAPGENIERHVGQVTVQIFTDSGKGEGEALTLADVAKGIFRSWVDLSSGVRFRVPPYARQIGVEGKWYQVNVVAPFEFDAFN